MTAIINLSFGEKGESLMARQNLVNFKVPFDYFAGNFPEFFIRHTNISGISAFKHLQAEGK